MREEKEEEEERKKEEEQNWKFCVQFPQLLGEVMELWGKFYVGIAKGFHL